MIEIFQNPVEKICFMSVGRLVVMLHYIVDISRVYYFSIIM